MSDAIQRRDPRAEWIARNRLHPLHESIAITRSAETRGPSGLVRKNPHGLGFMGPNGIKRIDRQNGNQQSGRSDARRRSQKSVELPLHRVAEPTYFIAVVPDMTGGRLTAHDRDLLGQAQQLVAEIGGDGAVLAIVFGDHREDGFDKAGVDRLMCYSDAVFNGYSPEQRTQVLAQVDDTYAPKFWLFPDSVAGGFELGCRLGACLQESVATQARQMSEASVVCRAASGSVDITRATPRIVLLIEECAHPVDETRHEALALTPVAVGVESSRIQDLGPVAVDPNSVALAEAEFILAAGNGVTDWDQFHRAAELLGATEGASRVVVDDGYMPRFRQVGATGTWVTARVYVAVGISGAVQHLQGIGQCEKVIAINTDPGCDMVKRAALSVIGDSSEILAELIGLIGQSRSQEVDDAA